MRRPSVETIIEHFPCAPYIEQDKNGTYRIRVSAYGEFPIKAELWCHPNNEPCSIDMPIIIESGDARVYEAIYEVDRCRNYQYYYFKFIFENDVIWFALKGQEHSEPLTDERFVFTLNRQTPSWIRDQLFYQIFPDRFASSKISDSAFASQFAQNGETPVECVESAFYGGDIRGIIGKLDYIEKLGFTAIYLNPIFRAISVHRYDPLDFSSIDPRLGTNEDFDELCAEVKKRGLKIILDIPANQISDQSELFDRSDMTGCGACCHEDSPYRDCFTFENGKEAGGRPDAGASVKLDYGSETVRRIIYEGEDSAITAPLSHECGIDGWRIDACHMIGEGGTAFKNHYYLTSIYNAAKKANPESFILGDHYYDAKAWLCTDRPQEDGAMNIQGFYKPVMAFLMGQDYDGNKIKYAAEDLKRDVENYHSGISQEMLLNMFNQIGNHDTIRIATRCSNKKQMMKLAFAMMFTWIGVPCVFAGDEIGTKGLGGAMSRSAMDWNQTSMEFRNIIKIMSVLRKRNEALRAGAFRIVKAEGRVFVYERSLGNKKIVTIINAGSGIYTADLSANIKSMHIQNMIVCNESTDSYCELVPQKTRDAAIVDNIRIMPYAEVLDSPKIKIGPLSALIFV